ncbi:MAG: hypothetical protein HYW85_01505 [Deltaproteobacteria bacterium]|nr:hypothetical protein [Deltaproteobacteria bacterium]
MTEFLFVIVLLVFLVLAHTQLSLSYVFANVIHYATFMAARAESVQPDRGASYLEDMVGTPTASKLPMVHFLPSAVNNNQFSVGYQLLSYIPLWGQASGALLKLRSSSPVLYEPSAIDVLAGGGVLDNE